VKRRLTNVATAMSLVVCLGLAALIVRSWIQADTIAYFQDDGSQGGIGSRRGTLYLMWDTPFAANGMPPREYRWLSWPVPEPPMKPRTVSFLGFRYYSMSNWRANSLPTRFCAIPLWFFLVLTGAMPMAWAWRRVRRRLRVRDGCCAGCGYDMRATPERCPECGLAFIPSPGTSRVRAQPGWKE
jgi:hypothetical protein